MRRSDFMLGGRDFKTLVASQIMETNVERISENTSWREAARIMTDNELKSLPVVDDSNGLLGLITEYDILGPIAESKDVKMIKAKDIVSKDVQKVTGDTPAMAVLKTFDDKRVFKIFVIENDVLKGVIVKHDVLLAYLNTTEEAPKGF
ncbi:MAG: CBS domain-containing protein [Candidatus Anammoxibacter sp.]